MRPSRPITLAGICIVAIALLGAAPRSRAQTLTPIALCRAAIRDVERGGGVPPDLLSAIGVVESGRRDPRSGAWGPWPWTIDAAGQPAFFDSKDQAMVAVRALQARGVQSIDVGCMQVNLLQHPLAFSTLEQAFDPASNVRYAARFLRTLHDRTGAWPTAAALYHSATPDLGEAYRRRVMAAWQGGAWSHTPQTPQTALARAWAATLSGQPAMPFALVRRLRGHQRSPSRLAAIAR